MTTTTTAMDWAQNEVPLSPCTTTTTTKQQQHDVTAMKSLLTLMQHSPFQIPHTCAPPSTTPMVLQAMFLAAHRGDLVELPPVEVALSRKWHSMPVLSAEDYDGDSEEDDEGQEEEKEEMEYGLYCDESLEQVGMDIDGDNECSVHGLFGGFQDGGYDADVTNDEENEEEEDSDFDSDEDMLPSSPTQQCHPSFQSLYYQEQSRLNSLDIEAEDFALRLHLKRVDGIRTLSRARRRSF